MSGEFEDFVNEELPKRISTATDPTNVTKGLLPVTTGSGLSVELKSVEEVALQGRPGVDGKSSYAIAVEGGYTGTEVEFNAEVTALTNSVTAATEQALVAKDEAIKAENAKTQAETARDTFNLNVGRKADIAAGLASTTNGQSFTVLAPDSLNYIIEYKNNNGVALEVKGYPSSIAVQQPAWAGKKNGWPDPFFKEFDLNSQNLLGKDRWWCSTGAASDTQTPLQQGGWTRVKSVVFNGYSLRRTKNIGTTPLNGPVIILADIDVAEGDFITAYQLFSGDGAVINAYVRFDDGADRSYVGPQIGMTTDSNAGTLLTSTTPQRMKASIKVPPGAKRLMTYTYTATPDKTFDILALWSFKGGLNDGPSWPSMDDTDVTDYRVDSLVKRMDTTEPATNYVVDQYSKVTAGAESITLNGTGFAGFARNLVFMGWGETYSPAGVTFNALRVKVISRATDATAKWKSLNVVVKTGPSPESNTGVVVAIGKASVLEQRDSLTDVTFVLKDPITGANKTLDNSSFTDNKYFIGVWALTKDGTPAACGEPRGVMSNSLLQSFYHQSSVNRPLNGTWNTSTAGANNRQAFQHLNLTNPLELIEYAPKQDFVNALGETTAIPVPKVVLPPYMYAMEGLESNLYFNNLFLCEANDYLIDVDSTGGRQQNERLTWTATGPVTNGVLTIKVADKLTGKILFTGQIQQRAAALSAGAGLTKKCLFVGDSLIQKGLITQTQLDLNKDDPMKIELLGTLGSGLNKHEGRGGWTVGNYVTAGVVSYRFTVTGVTVVPAINAAEYSHNGAVYRVQETNIVDGSGTITCSVVSGGAPLSSGTLTKTNSADGDSTITFSASATLSGNPFWFNGQVDFTRYLTTNSIPVPDWTFLALGINNAFSSTSDAVAIAVADSALQQLDILIASIKASGPDVRIGLVIPTPPSSDQDSFGTNYGSKEVRWRYKRNILLYAEAMIAKYSGLENTRVYLVPSNIALDTVNNMSRGALAPVNSRSTIMIARQDNGVHPADPGYFQLGDAIRAFTKCNI